MGEGAAALICNELVVLFLNTFVQPVVGLDYIDDMDLIDTEALLNHHVYEKKAEYKRGYKC